MHIHADMPANSIGQAILFCCRLLAPNSELSVAVLAFSFCFPNAVWCDTLCCNAGFAKEGAGPFRCSACKGTVKSGGQRYSDTRGATAW